MSLKTGVSSQKTYKKPHNHEKDNTDSDNGQGYNGYDECNTVVSSGGVSLAVGQSLDNKNIFYEGLSSINYDWVSPQDATLWNSGTEDSPLKNIDNDPCPSGWRVPTYEELEDLMSNHSSWTSDANGHNGYWFSGSVSNPEDEQRIFLPAAGNLPSYTGFPMNRSTSLLPCCSTFT